MSKRDYLWLISGCLSLVIFWHNQAKASDWSIADKQRQVAYTVLHIMDWAQTRNIARHSDWYEVNPIMGKRPSQATVNQYFATTLLLHYIVVDRLPPSLRRKFQVGTITIQAYTVGRNHSLGIQMRF